jgi:hypothetical protein
VDALHQTLNLFCDGSGQKINLNKSTIFFGNGCRVEIKDAVKQKLGVYNESLKDSYLGMPTNIGHSPVMTFRYIFDRMWQRANTLSDRPLSRAGSEAMLKAIIQAIPTYVMSCFQLPVAICEQMRKLIANEWWGKENGRRKKEDALAILGMAIFTKRLRGYGFQGHGNFPSSNAGSTVLETAN